MNKPITSSIVNDPVYFAALRAYSTYYSFMSETYNQRWPKKQPAENKYWKYFYQVGQLCVKEDFDPESYVRYALDRIIKNHKYITPKDLLNNVLIAKYKLDDSLGGLFSPEDDWEYFSDVLSEYVEDTNSDEITLLENPLLPFPAWFRLIYPKNLSKEILDRYGLAGMKEINSYKVLLNFVEQNHSKRLQELREKIN